MRTISNILLLIAILLFISTCSKNSTEPKSKVSFPDQNFEALIRETLDKLEGDITPEDLETIILLE